MDPSGQLRSDFDEVDNDGGGVSELLAKACDSIGYTCIDDSYQEYTHAAAQAVKNGASGFKWEWGAGTVPLKDNLRDLPIFLAATGADLRKEWGRWKSLAQSGVEARQAARPRRMTDRAFYDFVYKMEPVRAFLILGGGGRFSRRRRR